MNISFSKAICLHVTSYENLTDRGESIITFIDHILSSFLPYLKNELVIELEKTNYKSIRMPYNLKNINKVKKMFRNKEVQQILFIDNYEWDDDPHYDENAPTAQYPPDFCLGITCNYASTFSSSTQENCFFPNDISFSLSDKVVGEQINYSIQQQFIDLFEHALSITNGVTGFITFETISGVNHLRTPFENYYKIDLFNKPGYTQYVKGYYWITFLSNQHIDKLGGLNYITEHAPCFSHKRLPSGILLQLSVDINLYTDDQLRELRAFLSPLFPPNVETVTPLEFYGDPIHRLVE